MKKIILCATQRCGSTLVVEDMRNTGVLGQPKEWFLSWASPKEQERDWNKALETVYKRGRGENGVFAVKLMANQLFAVESALAGITTARSDGEFAHVATEFEGAAWVWLRRRDVVAQAVSRLMARQTKINHATANPDDTHFAGNAMRGLDPDYNRDTIYNYAEILRIVTTITLENLAWAQFFESNGITPIRFDYEDIIADPDMRHLDAMATAIGLEDKPPRSPRKLVKLGNARNRDWQARFMAQAAQNRYRLPKKRPPA